MPCEFASGMAGISPKWGAFPVYWSVFDFEWRVCSERVFRRTYTRPRTSPPSSASRIVTDNLAFSRTVQTMGFRTNASTVSLAEILPEDVETEVKEAAEISMGTEISDEDLLNIQYLCAQVQAISEYRAQLFEYLKNRFVHCARGAWRDGGSDVKSV